MKKITLFMAAIFAVSSLMAQVTVSTERLWEFSSTSANYVGTGYADDTKNGMDIKLDGTKLYLSTRLASPNQVAIYNTATGVREGYLPGLTGFASTYGGDVTVDDNGAIYASNVIISAAALTVAKWSSETATPTVFISTTAHTGSGTNRVGYGMDVRINSAGNGFIIMHKNGTAAFLIWTITNNVPTSQDPTIITATPAITDSYARISIVGDNTFWFDGSIGLPYLCTITKSGPEINATPTAIVGTVISTRSDVNTGVCGTTEFTLAGKRYLVIAANNHSVAAPWDTQGGHMSRLQEMAATGRAVNGPVIATLPTLGMGKITDASHFVESVVYVSGNNAYVYSMGGLNGLAAFKVTALPTKTFTVTVPNGTPKVYIAGAFTLKNWDITSPYELTATANPNEFTGTFPCVDGVEYKYYCEKADWDYEEGRYDPIDGGNDPVKLAASRTYNAADNIILWYRVNKVTLNASFEAATPVPSQLFVKGGFNGWATGIEMTKTGSTFSTVLGGAVGDKFPANNQYKYYTNDGATDNWENNADNTPKGNRWSIAPVMNDVVARFTTMLITELNNVEINARVARTYSGIEVNVDNESTIELYNMNGVLIDKTRTNGTYSRDLNNGVYIIRINGKATKFVK